MRMKNGKRKGCVVLCCVVLRESESEVRDVIIFFVFCDHRASCVPVLLSRLSCTSTYIMPRGTPR